MASCMAMSYGPQVAQVNEEPALESCLDLTLMQHPRDENPEPQEVRICLEVNQSPSSLVLSHFFELSHFGDFVTIQPHFR